MDRFHPLHLSPHLGTRKDLSDRHSESVALDRIESEVRIPLEIKDGGTTNTGCDTSGYFVHLALPCGDFVPVPKSFKSCYRDSTSARCETCRGVPALHRFYHVRFHSRFLAG